MERRGGGHRPLRTPPRECNKCSAPSRVYPLTEQWFLPPGRGSFSLGRIIPPKDYLPRPLTAEEKVGGSRSGGAPTRKIGWPAADRVALPILLASIHLSTESLIYIVISTFVATLPPSPERISHAALLGSAAKKGFL